MSLSGAGRGVRIDARNSVLLVFVSVLVSGCTTSQQYRFVRACSLSDAVRQIEVGRTTKAELLDILGAPDFEINGTVKKIDSSSPIARVKERIDQRMAQGGGQAKAVGSAADRQFNSAAWLEYQPYGSIGEKHIAFLYLEIEGSWRQKMTPPVVPLVLVMMVRANDTVRRNKLLVLVDKRTEIVDRVAYGEEFAVH